MRLLFDGAAVARSRDPGSVAGARVLERNASKLRRAQRRLIPKISIFVSTAQVYICAVLLSVRNGKMIFAAALLACGASALAGPGASNFTLVNGTGAPLSEVSIRRAGTQEWKTLGSSPAVGQRAPVNFKDPDCAFDIRAKVAGKDQVTWAGINLCDVKSVTLNRDQSAGPWVDYDQ